MEKILGLDLGTNSIGWAIREVNPQLENQIIDKGVLTFEKGVAEGKSGEFPMVQKRTESRGKRRNYQAEKYRKWSLLETLIENQMCPLSIEDLNNWRHYTKGTGRKYPQAKSFIEWLRFDFDGDGKPDFERFGLSRHESFYVFRSLASENDEKSKSVFKENPQILGRIFYQLVQRRGFRGRDENESKTIMEGGGDSGAKGVEEINPYLERYRTLGSALYHLQKQTGERIRKRYNLRSDYERELKIICETHGLGEELHRKLWKAIIWQRPLRSQKGLVGICTFEKAKSRAPISHPLYEEFRTWVFINNLKIYLPPELNREDYLSQKIYPLFYAASDFKLKKIYDRLKKDGGRIEARFNDETKVLACTLLYNFQKLLGADWKTKYGWDELLTNKPQKPGYSVEDIWHVLATFDSKEKLKEFAMLKLGLTEDVSEQFSKIRVPQGYATLGLSAIKKLLPYLKKGLKYSHAVYLGNMHKVLGVPHLDDELANNLASLFSDIEQRLQYRKKVDEIVNSLIADHQSAAQRWGMDPDYKLDDDDRNDIDNKAASTIGERTWAEMVQEKRDQLRQSVAVAYQNYLQQPIHTPLAKLFPGKERLHDAIFKHLQETYDLPDAARKHLWHPSEQETYAPANELNGIKYLGDPQPISRGFKNPMALKTLHQLKRLLNYLLQVGKIDEDTRVVIEIARELNDANRRKAIERWQRDRERENIEYRKQIAETLSECGVSYEVNQELLDKYRLWIEQNRRCLYTGKQIGFCEWFNGNLFDFEHTIPASMSFDNELKNLTLADGVYNKQIKGKRLPTELPNYLQDAVINGQEYTAIKPRLKFMEDKVNALENTLDEWVKKTSDDKSTKDAIIQRRHMIRMDLDYWRRKLETFTITEYKAGWRNSQLRDTQVITKYALPYLKTVFNKVDVQKGAVTAAFREIYAIQPRAEKKDRAKHSHHALDAAVLTLIPPAATRDKILLRYNEEKDNNPHNTYHESVRHWKSFRAEHILCIENDVLINFQPKHRTLTQTFKNVRKRGRQQFVKEKTPDGKWQFKLDDSGNKIPLKAKGNTIRGQLHNDSFFAARKQPVYEYRNGKHIPKTDGLGNFVFQKNDKRGDEIFFFSKPLTGLSYITKLDDIELVIDPNLRAYLKKEMQHRMEAGKTFAQAWQEPFWAFGKKTDKNGNALSPIRNLRCRVKGGGGGFVNNPSSIRKIEAFPSNKKHKQTIYALNGETTICAFYQGLVEGELIRAIEPISILAIAKSEAKSFNDAVAATKEVNVRKAVHLVHLYAVLMTDQKVIFYEENIEELKDLPCQELGRRLYQITKFEDGRVSLKHHLVALPEDELKKELKRMGFPEVGASSFDFSKPAPKLRLSKNAFNFALENKHFSVNADGQINWLHQ